MKKQMSVMLIILAVLFGCIFGYKLIMNLLMKFFISQSMSSHVTYVSAMPAKYSLWQPQVKASGSLRAILGVDVTTEAAGMVQTVLFTPGALVKKDDVLVQLNIAPDLAQLHALQASAELAKITYNRDKAQLAVQAVSQATVDTDEANVKNFNAQVEQQAANIAKKVIRAPFAGRLGISLINPGQYLNPGDKIVSLQTMNPIYVDFFVPQQTLEKLAVGQNVHVVSDAFPERTFEGKITTINSAVDTSTRNIEVEATVTNPKYLLTPGMYATVTVEAGKQERYITVPLTALSFNSFGDIIYVLEKNPNDKHKKKDKPQTYIAHQKFVTTGEKRGDQIAILKGLNDGDLIVTSGQLKLRNGSVVAIDNSAAPENNPAPIVVDE